MTFSKNFWLAGSVFFWIAFLSALKYESRIACLWGPFIICSNECMTSCRTVSGLLTPSVPFHKVTIRLAPLKDPRTSPPGVGYGLIFLVLIDSCNPSNKKGYFKYSCLITANTSGSKEGTLNTPFPSIAFRAWLIKFSADLTGRGVISNLIDSICSLSSLSNLWVAMSEP